MDEPAGYMDVVTDDGRVVPLTIQTCQILDPTQLRENVAENLKRNPKRFFGREGFFSRKEGPIAIVSGGPSLRRTINDLRDFERIISCGSVHDYLVKNGVVPTYAVVCDGGKEDKGNLSLPQKETTFLLASQCDPALYEHLKDYNVEMWHYRGQLGTPQEEAEVLKGEPSMAWGSTATINSVVLALALGYQHLHFFGFDNNYEDYGLASHCDQIKGGVEYDKVPVTVGGRMFITNLNLITQVEQFFKLMELDGQFFHSTIHGDGLTAEMVRNGEPGLEKYVSLV